MTEAEKNRNIAAQTAAKVAGEILAGSGADQNTVAAYIRTVYEQIVALAPISDTPASPAPAPVPVAAPPVSMQQAQQNVMAAFPQATPVPVQQAPQPQQGLHPGSTTKELWADLINNRNNWWDNRQQGDTSIAGGQKPDFRHKSLEKDGNKVALWLNGKFGPAPDWVWQGLGLQPPPNQAQQAQQMVAQAAAPQPQAWGPDEAPF
jgi:hypothetical protein